MRRSPSLLALPLALCASTLTGSALAAVSTPFPGVTVVDDGNRVMAIADLCAPGVSVRATAYDERRGTPQEWATKAGVNADVAINADFFDFPGWTYVIGHARGNGKDWPGDKQNKEARVFWQFGPALADLASKDPSAIATEIVGGHNVIIRDGHSTGPGFDGDAVILTSHRRTGIGLSGSRTKLYVFATDLSLEGNEMAAYMFAMASEGGAPAIDIATNEDGGGSSQLYVRGQGQVITSGRQVNNHLGILAKGSGASPQCSERKPTQPLPTIGPTECGKLKSGEGLSRTQAISSCDGRFTLRQQSDGNLVLYAPNGKHIWTPMSIGRDGGYAFDMQKDGNLVLYSPFAYPLFVSNTSVAGAEFALQNDGNGVVYGSGKALFQTQTSGAEAPPANAPTTALPQKPTACGKLLPDEGLARGQSLVSCDGRFTLTMQNDGDLTLRTSDNAVIWRTDTVPAVGYALAFAGGNLAVATPFANTVWDTGTGGHAAATFSLQDDGNLVVRDGTTALWNSGTVTPNAPPPVKGADPSKDPSGAGNGNGNASSANGASGDGADLEGGCATLGSQTRGGASNTKSIGSAVMALALALFVSRRRATTSKSSRSSRH